MEQQPLVSVGIPTYNRPDGLRKTLECIIGQTYENLEIILSDNCSPDPDVEEITNEFVNKDKRIKYYRQDENKGAAFNFKFVFEKASGEYFMWACDDDEWSLKFIDECVGLLEANPKIGMAFTNFENVTPWGRKCREVLSPQRYAGTASWKSVSRFVLTPEYFGGANIICSVFRKQLLHELISILDLTWNSTAIAGDVSLVLGGIARSGLIVSNKTLFKKFLNLEQWGRSESDNTFIDIDFSKRGPPYIFSFLEHPDYLHNNLLVTRDTRYYYLVVILCYLRILEEITRKLFEQLLHYGSQCIQVIKSLLKFILRKVLSKDKYNMVKEKFKKEESKFDRKSLNSKSKVL